MFLGSTVQDFGPEPSLMKWLEAPFLKKIAEGGAFTGSLTSSLGVRGGRAWALEKHRASELQRFLQVPSRVPYRATL